MKAILLDGSQPDDNTGARVRTALMSELQAQGWRVEHFALCEQKIGNCAGDFFCWIRSPGVCNVNDDNRIIAKAIVNSDLIVYLSPITFGGYSSSLKSMVDHQIQNISPFFTKIEGETHHHKRYKKNPDLLVVGWTDTRNEHIERVFRHLVHRNAINFHAKTWISDVVLANQSTEDLQVSTQRWLDDLQSGRSSRWVELPDNSDPSALLNMGAGRESFEIRRALLLVGSPKTRKSTSNSLGEYLFEQLKERSIETETIYVHTVLRSPAKMQALLDAVNEADIVTLAFPLYVDSLPAPVTEVLERIARHRQGLDRPQRQMFTAIANCGFPEAHHCTVSLAICEIFARQAGFEWGGALALGGGGMVNGSALAEGGGRTIRIRQSLEQAAETLVLGRAIPKTAQDMMARPAFPHWAYRLMGGLGWIQVAKSYGVLTLLKHQPYLTKTA